jgi:hypothetical protein
MMTELDSLENLILDHSFSTQYYDFNQNTYCDEEIYPYDEYLSDVFDSLTNLKVRSIS